MSHIVQPAAYKEPELPDRVRHEIRTRHTSRRTEDPYVHRIKRFIFFHGERHPTRLPLVLSRHEVQAILAHMHDAPHLLEDGYDIRTVHELLGHPGVSTTMNYTHVLHMGCGAVRSPADRFGLAAVPMGLPVSAHGAR